jgi:hypothetical protein
MCVDGGDRGSFGGATSCQYYRCTREEDATSAPKSLSIGNMDHLSYISKIELFMDDMKLTTHT